MIELGDLVKCRSIELADKWGFGVVIDVDSLHAWKTRVFVCWTNRVHMLWYDDTDLEVVNKLKWITYP